jgi:choice-of-anchor C domain-containing protein
MGVCEPGTGICSNPAKQDGSTCDDGNACTQTDTCVAGVCTGGNPVVCTALDQCHDVGTCDQNTGLCSNPLTNCDDSNGCTTDSCDPVSGCAHTPISCDDSNVCTNDFCSPATGCYYQGVADGTDCTTEPGPCQGVIFQPSVCGGGQCQPLPPVTCDDGNICTDDSCDPENGCVYTPVLDRACVDGNACTTNDRCDANGACVDGAPLNCDDSNPCTTDTCDTTSFPSLIENGDFEIGTDPGPSFITAFSGDTTTIPGWAVVAGSVDYIGGTWPPSHGARSIDLSGQTAGNIQTAVTTKVGTLYRVTFDMAGNPAEPPDNPNPVKTMRVTAAALSDPSTPLATALRTFDTTGITWPLPLTGMGWVQQTFDFIATETTTILTFKSLMNSAYGPALDNVRVIEEPADACVHTGLTDPDNLSCSAVTDSSLCPLPDPFNLNYKQTKTKDVYELNSSNPGQFYYNVFYAGAPQTPPASTTLTIQIPYPFVTQGANPIQIHDSAGASGITYTDCFAPGGSLSGYTITTGTHVWKETERPVIVLADYGTTPAVGTTFLTVTITGPVPASGLLYVTIHLDYGFKQTTGWAKSGSSPSFTASNPGGPAPNPISTPVTILTPQPYTFSFANGGTGDTRIARSRNQF